MPSLACSWPCCCRPFKWPVRRRDRAGCINNLRQTGTAIHLFHDAKQSFPPGGYSPDPCCSTDSYTSWTIEILPFLEQKPTYELYNQAATNESIENKAVRETFIPVYSCPSDIARNVKGIPDSGPGGDLNLWYMPGSYRGVGGRSDAVSGWWDNTPEYLKLSRRWRGVFHVIDGVPPGVQGRKPHLQPETFATVRDGSSYTIMVGEYCTRPSRAILRRRYPTGLSRRTFWAYTHASYNRSDAVPQSRTLLADYDRCTSIGGQGGFKPCDRAWGSFHTDVNNFLLCDGSVRSLPLTIDMQLFANAATIAGKDPKMFQ